MTSAELEIQATVNGQTVTIGKISTPDNAAGLFSAANNAEIAMALSRPIKVDAGTAINLVLSGGGGTLYAAGVVHTISQAF